MRKHTKLVIISINFQRKIISGIKYRSLDFCHKVCAENSSYNSIGLLKFTN